MPLFCFFLFQVLAKYSSRETPLPPLGVLGEGVDDEEAADLDVVVVVTTTPPFRLEKYQTNPPNERRTDAQITATIHQYSS